MLGGKGVSLYTTVCVCVCVCVCVDVWVMISSGHVEGGRGEEPKKHTLLYINLIYNICNCVFKWIWMFLHFFKQ